MMHDARATRAQLTYESPRRFEGHSDVICRPGPLLTAATARSSSTADALLCDLPGTKKFSELERDTGSPESGTTVAPKHDSRSTSRVERGFGLRVDRRPRRTSAVCCGMSVSAAMASLTPHRKIIDYRDTLSRVHSTLSVTSLINGRDERSHFGL
ncbi:meiotically up-regulated gene 62 protein [Pseudozyma hubeiensis SY62]|uniref:Meiotically up-regulated gene 62 protein n=1 Tax=Pseudozyma hubeiensis (strain SY62) TaxID=1305764 RepID=R9PA97_PSEHS|nr:meiotically up-regulated gene 62 protein [Pseudozyma hubeiensis SY62]GAC98293.1 meiotically up-regulated gene 62 protein [Pseudozyma hubeiensis SY62]